MSHLFPIMPGRPKKIRRRGPNEPPASSSNPIKLKRVQRSLNCRTCGASGHNSRTCNRKTLEENQNVEADEVEIGASQPYPESQISQPPQQVNPEIANNPPMEVEPSTANQPPQKRRKLPVKRSATSTASPGVNPLANTLQSSQPPSSNPNNMKKKAILDKKQQNDGQVHIRGSDNILNSSGVSSPVIVKGGVNYITMSNPRSYVGKSSKEDSSKEKRSASGSGKHSEKPN